jgi:hypothetical protein
MWSSSGISFLSSPPANEGANEHIENAESAVLDDSSAHQYTMSKMAEMADLASPKDSPMTINHVVEPPQTRAEAPVPGAVLVDTCGDSEPVTSPVKKRKAEQMSESTPEEEQLNVQATAPVALPEDYQPAGQAESFRVNDGHVQLVTGTTRPVKRLRRMAEVFGYAAMGGAFVMSALIATAPELWRVSGGGRHPVILPDFLFFPLYFLFLHDPYLLSQDIGLGMRIAQ